MAGLPDVRPIRALIQRGRSLAALPFVRPALKWRRLPRTYGSGASVSGAWFAFLRVSFAVMVLLPTLVAAVYSGLIASPVYLSEARVAIRESLSFPPVVDFGADDDADSDSQKAGGNKGSSSTMPQGKSVVSSIAKGLSNLLGGVTGPSHTQAPFILANYARSLDYVAKLDEDGWLRRFFTGPTIDRWQALRPDTSLERLRTYWDKHVTVAVDRRAEIVLLSVRAFSPEDAQVLAQRILKDGERLLNEIVIQSRTDAVTRARAQLDRVQKLYTEALVRQQEWRMRQRAVDPILAAEALGTSLMRLEQERISADREIRVLQRLSAPDSATIGVLRDRLGAIDGEIASFKQRFAQVGGTGSAVDALAAYEESELRVRFTETLQAIAVAGLQDAERRLRSQSAFVNVFVPPSLPTSKASPSWLETTLFVFVLATIIWVNVTILIAVIRDHLR
ncbi:hypothetical protein LJE71_18625 [Xanthobacter autotrophicus]|uniref:hypothetical protein n=1 Tax=Xanthobacter autotrophicus TaxID=280 RepID=UPI001E31F325|nr:hypothetical protein [Xanthobacter autotrophicus]UDQ88263.1 hypothetical protein LJE71_18625 [Xanthobacter autotrophicus]